MLANMQGSDQKSIASSIQGRAWAVGRENGAGLNEHAVAHQVTVVEVLVTVDDLKLASNS
jgi:hypothetical protein